MAKIGIDLSIVKINQAGSAIYAQNLVDALIRYQSEHEYIQFASSQRRDMDKKRSFGDIFQTVSRAVFWTHGILPLKAARSKVDLLHMPANVIPFYSPVPTVVTIFDMAIYITPQFFPSGQRIYTKVLIPRVARKSSMIVTISHNSKKDIVKYLKVPEEKVKVTHIAASPAFKPLPAKQVEQVKAKYGLDRFILNVCTLEPRKNLAGLLQAFSKLRQAGQKVTLVHAGPKGWLYDEIYSELARLDLGDSVRLLGRVPLQDLVGLYNAAEVFVYPSHYEGFGIPVLEAMSCGCPVITSNNSSLPEVIGDAGIMIDPNDILALTSAIQRILEDKTLAHSLKEKGLERAKIFSWKKTAQQTLDIYNQVINP